VPDRRRPQTPEAVAAVSDLPPPRAPEIKGRKERGRRGWVMLGPVTCCNSYTVCAAAHGLWGPRVLRNHHAEVQRWRRELLLLLLLLLAQFLARLVCGAGCCFCCRGLLSASVIRHTLQMVWDHCAHGHNLNVRQDVNDGRGEWGSQNLCWRF